MTDKTNPNEWPTKEMIAAGMRRMFDEKRYMAPWDDVIALMFTDMLAAAPKVEREGLTDAQIADAIPDSATILNTGEQRKVCMTRLQLRQFVRNLASHGITPAHGEREEGGK